MNNNLLYKLSILLISFLIFWSLKDFFLLIICSLVISNIVCNLCNKLKKSLKISRPLSLLVVWLSLTIIFFVSIVLVLPPFIKEFNEILVDIPNALTRLNLIINSNIDRINKIIYGEETDNIFEILQIFNSSISLPDSATIAKAIQGRIDL